MQLDSTNPPEIPSTPTSPTFGLSKDHIRPRLALTLARGGEMVEISSHGWQTRVTTTTTRGAVTDFSKRSRRRCLRTIACVDKRRQDRPPVFITLTYPDRWPGTPADLKRDLAVLWKRLAKRFPWIACIWRVELQKRGAPHYHLLLFGLSFLDHAYLARQWYEVVGSGNPEHLTAGTEVRACRNWKDAAVYVAKYLAKFDPTADPQTIGRHWGVKNRSQLPSDLVSYRLDWPSYFAIKEQLERLLWPGDKKPPDRGDFCGCWVAAPGWTPPAAVLNLLDGCIISAVDYFHLT